MSKVRSSNGLRVLALLFSAVLLCNLPTALAETSTSMTDGITATMVTSLGYNWTAADSGGTINLVVASANAGVSLDEINITIPTVGGNPAFNVSSASSVNGTWACTGLIDDGEGNWTIFNCSTATENIDVGTQQDFTLTFHAIPLSTETVYEFNVTAFETPSYSASQNLTFGIDGAGPQFYGYRKNATYFGNDETINFGATVYDITLNTSSVSMRISSLPGGTIQSTPAAASMYLGGSEWNYTVNATLSSLPDGNYTFNLTASDNLSNSNTTLYTGWFFHDIAAPSVSLDRPANGSYRDNGPMVFNFTPSDTSLSISDCTLWITNSTGDWVQNESNSAPVNGVENNISIPYLGTGTYTWNVLCTDMVGNTSFATQNSTLIVQNRSNIMVLGIEFPLDPSPFPGQNMLINVTVKNNGSEDVGSNILLQLKADYEDDDCSSPFNTSTYNISSSFLAAGDQKSVYYNITLQSNHGTYYVCADADYTNAEADEVDNGDNTLTNSTSTELNVTLYSIHLNSTAPNATNAEVGPSDEVTVKLNVTFYNGTPVTSGIIFSKVNITDDWSHSQKQRVETVDRKNTSDFKYTYNASGVYVFNYTVPGFYVYESSTERMRYAEYGLHHIDVYVEENGTGHNYRGTSLHDSSYYTIIAPYLSISTAHVPSSTRVGDKDEIDITYSNNGNENITSNITAYEPTYDDAYVGEIDINNWNSTIIPGLNATGTYYLPNVEMEATENGTCYFLINMSVEHENEYYWYTYVKVIDIDPEATDDNTQDTTAATTTATDEYECTSNTSCDSDEWCNRNLECVSLDCPDGYVATGHACKLQSIYKIGITAFDSALSLTQGESLRTNVTVKNTGNKDITVAISVDLGLEGLEFNVTPQSASIVAGKTQIFEILINTTEATPVGKHNASFKATTSFITAKDSKSFILTVQPLPAAIDKIKTDYQNLTLVVEQLLADFESAKAQLTEGNLTALGTKVNETSTLFNLAKEAMEAGDYAAASTYMTQLNTLIASTRSLMSELGIKEGTGVVFWNSVMLWLVVAVVCIGAVGLLIYMMVPPQGYTLGKGYSPQGKRAFSSRVMDVLASLRGKMPGNKPTSASAIVGKYKMSYGGSYKKLDNAYKPQPKSVTDKMKNILKKK